MTKIKFGPHKDSDSKEFGVKKMLSDLCDVVAVAVVIKYLVKVFIEPPLFDQSHLYGFTPTIE